MKLYMSVGKKIALPQKDMTRCSVKSASAIKKVQLLYQKKLICCQRYEHIHCISEVLENRSTKLVEVHT